RRSHLSAGTRSPALYRRRGAGKRNRHGGRRASTLDDDWMTTCVVFAYHKVGVRCLKVLLSHGIDVALVVTHEDSAAETIWFDSVAATANEYGIPCTTPDEPNAPPLVQRISALT